jgi:hypothetical protein
MVLSHKIINKNILSNMDLINKLKLNLYQEDNNLQPLLIKYLIIFNQNHHILINKIY